MSRDRLTYDDDDDRYRAGYQSGAASQRVAGTADINTLNEQLRECRAQLATYRDSAEECMRVLESSVRQAESERDGWKRATESQNKQWSAKCEELTECRAELAQLQRAVEHDTTDKLILVERIEQAESERDTARAAAAGTMEQLRLQERITQKEFAAHLALQAKVARAVELLEHAERCARAGVLAADSLTLALEALR